MRIKKYVIPICFYCLLILLPVACAREPLVVFRGQTMGTFYTVKVTGGAAGKEQAAIQNTIDSVLNAVNQALNRYDKKSEISAFNRYRGSEAFPVSAGFMEVTLMAERIYRLSNAAFDPTVSRLVRLWGFGDDGSVDLPHPDTLATALKHVGFDKLQIHEQALQKKDPSLELDYSAIAKGYGVDKLALALHESGYENLLVEIGGEVRVFGNRHGKPWRIGIADPGEQNQEIDEKPATINLRNMACATSGDYQQYYMLEDKRITHLLDPRNGYPISHELTSVTVVASSCMLADAIATAAIVLGKEKGMALIESMPGVEAYFICHDGNALQSAQSSSWGK
jgi:FAD:protein FMN transferase